MDHLFMVAVLEITGFEPEFHKWINVLCQYPAVVEQENGIPSEYFLIKRSVQQGYPL